jgi:lipid A oxidase
MIRAARRSFPIVRTGDRIRLFDRLSSACAIVLLAATAGIWIAEQQAAEREGAAQPAGRPGRPDAADTAGAETMVAGYFGAPFTYRSDVRFDNPAAKTDFTLKRVGWDGKPFKHPIYYGVRIARWAPGNRSGVMVDFTHSKTITRPEEEVDIQGLIDGAPAPARARIGAMFKHLEFSHGHNMLTVNGLFRFASLAPRISPYAGVGLGISLPHTEVAMRGEANRTYEYQYAGPVGQALAGVEIRLGAASVFFEYKFSVADYRVPLSRLDGNLLVTDVWRQLGLWWQGVPPPGGHASSRLASHQVIGGAGYRFATP